MNRGVIILTTPEMSQASAFLKTSAVPISNTLLNKLRPSSTNPSASDKILISEEDAEILLDSLAAPTASEPAELKSLRLKLQQFIGKIRFPESTPA